MVDVLVAFYVFLVASFPMVVIASPDLWKRGILQRFPPSVTRNLPRDRFASVLSGTGLAICVAVTVSRVAERDGPLDWIILVVAGVLVSIGRVGEGARGVG